MIRGIVKTCSPEDTAKVFGSFDFNARMIEKVFGVCIPFLVMLVLFLLIHFVFQ